MGVSLVSGLICGFFAGLFPHPKDIFDDDEHWFDVFYGDYLDQYNRDPDAVPEEPQATERVPVTETDKPFDEDNQKAAAEFDKGVEMIFHNSQNSGNQDVHHSRPVVENVDLAEGSIHSHSS